jgi:hypothetical protein
MVPELEWGGGEEQHPLKDSVEFAAKRGRVLFGILILEQRCEPGLGILEVVGLVQNQ